MASSNRFCHFAAPSGGAPGRGRATSEAPPAQAPPNTASDRQWLARPAQAGDFEAWSELFAGYCAFYERPSTEGHRLRVWSWIEAGKIHCLLAVPATEATGGAVGLAHLRPALSPLRGATTGFLDDLFIVPAARGTGAFECLMDAIRALAEAEGWPQVRWITAADNSRARSAYERVATRTEWVTYQLDT